MPLNNNKSDPGFVWASDVAISMPEATSDDIILDMGTFGFSINGFVYNLKKADVEELKTPTFSPDLNS